MAGIDPLKRITLLYQNTRDHKQLANHEFSELRCLHGSEVR